MKAFKKNLASAVIAKIIVEVLSMLLKAIV